MPVRSVAIDYPNPRHRNLCNLQSHHVYLRYHITHSLLMHCSSWNLCCPSLAPSSPLTQWTHQAGDLCAGRISVLRTLLALDFGAGARMRTVRRPAASQTSETHTIHVLRDIKSPQHHNGFLPGVPTPRFVARVFRVADPIRNKACLSRRVPILAHRWKGNSHEIGYCPTYPSFTPRTLPHPPILSSIIAHLLTMPYWAAPRTSWETWA